MHPIRLRTSLAALTLIFFAFQGQAQSAPKPLFEGAEHLDSCVVELPLTYAKKDKDRYTQAARYLEDVELIYLTHDKKTHNTNYSRVYVVVMTAKDGAESVYLESTRDHMVMGGAKQAVFPQFKPSTQRFYNAECFDRQLITHPELKDRLKEEQ